MQTLVNLFLDGFIFVANTKKELQQGLQPTIGEMQEKLSDLFDKFEEKNKNESVDSSSLRYSEDIYETAKFAMAAFIDEMLFSSAWSFADDWMKVPLQKVLFNTVCAGQEFFDKLDEISGLGTREERDLAELFSYCIALGFQGAYYEDQEKLNFLMRSLYAKIVKHDDSYGLYKQDLPIAENIGKLSSFRISGRAFVAICVVVFIGSVGGIMWYLTYDLGKVLQFFAQL